MSLATRRSLRLSSAGVTCLLMAGYVQAQQIQQPLNQNPNQLRDPASAQQSDQRLDQPQQRTTHFRGPDAAGSAAAGSVQSVDGYLANCLLTKNNAEVKICEFAEGRAQSPQVKQFARQLAEDHQQISQRLSQIAANRGATGAQGGQAAMAGNQQALNKLLQIDRQIADKCVSMAQEKLGQKSGAEFDECFVTAQIGSHMQMLAALEVIAQQTDGQLQQTAQDTKSKVQQHLQKAENLAKQLAASDAGTRQARAQ